MIRSHSLKCASLNVNGLSNPVKRSKVLAKMKKDKAQIIFLQETHMSKTEHEKLKRFGYLNSFFSSCENSRKRGVATLISNNLNFEFIMEKSDTQGRYIIIKGRIDNILVTFANIYAPPESDRKFFTSLFHILISESEGVLVCAGDWNTVLNHSIDTLSIKRQMSEVKRSQLANSRDRYV